MRVSKKNTLNCRKCNQEYPVDTSKKLSMAESLCCPKCRVVQEDSSISQKGIGSSGKRTDAKLSDKKPMNYTGQATQTKNNDLPKGEFYNPYNFVRFLSAPLEKALLGRCQPPPHDRYVGLSGVLKCTGSVETPLFISDSHHIVKDEKTGHKTYSFFSISGKRYIPASSLRGMVRSVFEAATNSCLGIFDGDRLLRYREETNYGVDFVPAKVSDNARKLRLLPGSSKIDLNTKKGSSNYLHSAAVRVYRKPFSINSYSIDRNTLMSFRNKKCYALLQKKVINGEIKKEWEVIKLEMNFADLENVKTNKTIVETGYIDYFEKQDGKRILMFFYDPAGDGDHASTLPIVKFPNSWAKSWYKDWDYSKPVFARLKLENNLFWRVEELSEKKEDLQGDNIYQGYLYITGDNMDNKRSERFFFRSETVHANLQDIDLTDALRKQWEDLIGEAQERFADDVGKPNSKLSSYIKNEGAKKLNDGTLVYLKLENGKNDWIATEIYPIGIPRKAHANKIGDLLPDKDKRVLCSNYDELCLACRVFGWVKGGKGDVVAYKSRVRFSMGKATPKPGFGEQETLAILSTPKPTTARFYLVKKGSQSPLHGVDRKLCRYNSSLNELRGRKFYRHHGKADEGIYRMQGDKTKTGQNRSVNNILAPKSTFEFDVHFENLSPLELGALLWSLELEDGCCHRHGYGKPLGLGSIKVQVNEQQSRVLQPEKRYVSFTANAGWNSLDKGFMDDCKKQFKEEMQKVYGKSFLELDSIADLLAILRPVAKNVHYPRTRNKPENFYWFVDNEHKKLGDKLALGVAAIDKGLPYNPKTGGGR